MMRPRAIVNTPEHQRAATRRILFGVRIGSGLAVIVLATNSPQSDALRAGALTQAAHSSDQRGRPDVAAIQPARVCGALRAIGGRATATAPR